MITIDSVLSKKNKAAAFEHLSIKKNGGGTDKDELTELKAYWESNGERIEQEIRNAVYEPGLIFEYEIISGSGKKRLVNKMNMVDKFITRLLAQKLNHFYEPTFLPNSFAYQNGKGIQDAVEKARDYIERRVSSRITMARYT